MNYLKYSIVALFIGFFTNNLIAQNIKSQSEVIKSSLKKKKYKIIADHSERFGNIEVSDIEPDKNQPTKHYEVTLAKYPDKPNSRQEATYYRDNMAFPVTYLKNSYIGMEKIQRKVGYALSKRGGDERIVVTEKYIFMISDWKDKNRYFLHKVLELNSPVEKVSETPKKKEINPLWKDYYIALTKGKNNVPKRTFKYPKKRNRKGELDKLRKEVLQPYLDKAFEKQKIAYSKWVKSPKNANFKKRIDALYKKVQDADRAYVKRYNDSLSNTPEYRKIAAHRASLKRGSVFVYNNTGSSIWIAEYPSAPSMGLKYIPNGHSEQWMHCDDTLYYYRSEHEGAMGIKFYNGNSKCGGKVTIN